jgi:hypothetical protein
MDSGQSIGPCMCFVSIVSFYYLSSSCRQVLALMVPSRLEFISGGDWVMISD